MEQEKRRAARRAGVKALAVRKRKGSWSRATMRRFFDALAETSSVRGAAAKAGIDPSGAYQRRKTDATFRRLWEEAVAEAVERAEMLAMERALESAASDDPAKAGAALKQSGQILAARDARMKRDGQGQVACMPIDELERLLIRRLAAIGKRLARTAKEAG